MLFSIMSLLLPLFAADDGAGNGGAASDKANGDATGQQAQQAQQQNGGGDEKKFSQADIDRVVQERLERAQRKAESDAEKARKDAEAKALEQQGEFKTLAEQRQAKIAELEQQLQGLSPVQDKATRFETALKAQLDTLRKDLPGHITALLDKLDVAEQLEYIAQNREALAAPAQGQQRQAGRGSPAAQQQRQQAAQGQQGTQPARKSTVRL